MKYIVLMLSKSFIKGHPKAGFSTFFENSLRKSKLHTIRGNYKYWSKRFNSINDGSAVLSIRQWTGKPYYSPMKELVRLGVWDGIGLQRLRIDKNNGFSARIVEDDGRERAIDVRQLAHNDGLSVSDWCDWFANCDFSQDFALIHFTKFRY